MILTQNHTPTSKHTDITLDAAVQDQCAQLTLEEKVGLIHANTLFTSGGAARVGIPELVMSDGQHGVRPEQLGPGGLAAQADDASTYLPVGTALGATWNTDLGYKFGEVLGREASYRGKDVILGPGLNITRDPLNGRNFEYMTEDPFLNSAMVVNYVKGVQAQGIAACAKHYIANSLEYQRDKVDVRMSDRAFREIYLPGFKAAVQEGGVHTIMSAYNKFRGDYCSHSEFLLNTVLRDELGFQGAVISDWNAVKSTEGAATVGLDIEMGTGIDVMGGGDLDYDNFHLGNKLLELVQNGSVSEDAIDAKVQNILRVMHKIHKFDGQRPEGALNTQEHKLVARKVANESIVLLKNDDQLLPWAQSEVKKLAVVGANAEIKQSRGGGSSEVKAPYEITPLEGLENLLGDDVDITFARGFDFTRGSSATPQQISDAVNAVKDADAAIYVGGWLHGYAKQAGDIRYSPEWDDNFFDAETRDKPSMHLPFGQNELIEAVLDANPNTVIVLFGGGPVDFEAWGDRAKAILQAWYPGMEGGHALADILFGNVNQSGKLPMTFPRKLEDSPSHKLADYPDESLVIDHKEDIYVGYRYFDTFNVTPAYAFGHGLSYTSFDYSDLNIEASEDADRVRVNLTVKNTGNCGGAEVVQLYVHDKESTLERPEKELKAFHKVFLEPGTDAEVAFELDQNAFHYYDDQKGHWVLEPGEFTIMAGSSSRDIRLSKDLTLNEAVMI